MHRSWLTVLCALLCRSVGSFADVTMAELFNVDERSVELAVGAERFKQLQHAVEDFNAILNFKKPVHAKVDDDAPTPLDGGTHSIPSQAAGQKGCEVAACI